MCGNREHRPLVATWVWLEAGAVVVVGVGVGVCGGLESGIAGVRIGWVRGQEIHRESVDRCRMGTWSGRVGLLLSLHIAVAWIYIYICITCGILTPTVYASSFVSKLGRRNGTSSVC